MRRPRSGGGFRPIEEVAAAAGALLDHPDQGMHLRALTAWRRAVGERIDRVTRVAGMSRGTLTVDVPDRTWEDSLRSLEGTILSRVREGLGDDGPRRLELRVSRGVWRPPAPPPRRRSAASREAPAPDPTATPRGDASAGAPGDPTAEDPGTDAGGHPSAPGDLLTESEIPVAAEDLRQELCRLANLYLARGARRRR